MFGMFRVRERFGRFYIIVGGCRGKGLDIGTCRVCFGVLSFFGDISVGFCLG